MKILGIESSCDDTSVALLESSEAGHVILAHKTASQIDIHKKYGGVVPEVAGRLHAEAIVPLIEEVLAGEKPDVIAVTSGPGLITGLIVGVEAARTLSAAWNIPLVAVNHIEGHIHSAELEAKTLTKFPALALVVSGGHTELVLMKDHGDYAILGKTKDDAAGECFDKVAKLLGLTYPGGPEISLLAETGNPEAIHFPRPMLKEPNYDFSFAGLKTAALYYLRDHTLAAMHVNPIRLPAGVWGQMPEPPTQNDFCASIEEAIVDVLVAKTIHAALEYQPQTVLLVGGVAANKKLRATLKLAVKKELPQAEFRRPEIKYCMDNGAMIAAAGFWKAARGEYTHWQKISADPNWHLA